MEPASSPVTPSPDKTLGAFLAATPGPWMIGQALIRSPFDLLHADDAGLDPAQLESVASPEALRAWIRLDARGRFRPLRAAPDLRRGWIFRARDWRDLRLALDYLYPAALANGQLFREGKLAVTPWAETAGLQTGRFRSVREIGDAGAQAGAAEVCAPGCLKHRLWPPAAGPVPETPGAFPLLCPEACNYFVSRMREKQADPADD